MFLFSTFSPYKCMGTPIWPCHKKVKGQLKTVIWTNLVDLVSSMLYTKIQPQRFLVSGEEDFEVVFFFFFTIYEEGGLLVKWWELFEQIGNTLSTEGPMWNLVKIAQGVSEKKTFKNYTILYMHLAQRQGQITPRELNFEYN